MIVEPDFFDHWKTRMLVDLLDGDEAAPVYVQRLWAHCQNRRQVSFENFPPAALKALCRYPGHPSKLESGLVSSGFVRRDGAGVFTVLNWEKYNAGLIANWTNGEKGGRPPKNPPETHGLPMANPSRTDREEKRREEKNVNPKAEEPPLPPTGGGCVDPPGFVQFWEAWPSHFRKSARAKCLTHWRSAGLESLALVIVASVAAWRASEQWTKDTGQFIPAPLPWLRDRRWEAAAPPAKDERNGHSGSTGANRPARSGSGGNQAAREFPQLINVPVRRYGPAVGGPIPGSAGAT